MIGREEPMMIQTELLIGAGKTITDRRGKIADTHKQAVNKMMHILTRKPYFLNGCITKQMSLSRAIRRVEIIENSTDSISIKAAH